MTTPPALRGTTEFGAGWWDRWDRRVLQCGHAGHRQSAIPVQGLDTVIVRAQDVGDMQIVLELIDLLQKQSEGTQPKIDIVYLKHGDCNYIANTLNSIFARVTIGQNGNYTSSAARAAQVGALGAFGAVGGGAPQNVYCLALPRYNAVLIVAPEGRFDDVVREMRKLLDQQTTAGFRRFRLEKQPAQVIASQLQNFWNTRYPGENLTQNQFRVTLDMPNNAVLVQGSPDDLRDAEELIRAMDTSDTKAINDMRVFYLKNALSDELGQILSYALSSQVINPQPQLAFTEPIAQAAGGAAVLNLGTAARGLGTGLGGAGTGLGGVGLGGAGLGGAGLKRDAGSVDQRHHPDPRCGRKRWYVHEEYRDPVLLGAGRERLRDRRARGRPHRLQRAGQRPDRVRSGGHDEDGREAHRQPGHGGRARSYVNVYQLRRGLDATLTANLISQLFTGQGRSATTGTNLGTTGTTGTTTPRPLLVISPNVADGASLIDLRLSVDDRSNSIVVAGSLNDLEAIRAIISKLESADIQDRYSEVIKLRNAAAADVANTLQTYFNSVLAIYTGSTYNTSFQLLQRQVVLQADAVSNSILVSATPEYFGEIKKIIDKIDSQPPQVMIQVMIAEVDLNNDEEEGVEVGLQSPTLFGRAGAGAANGLGFNFNTPTTSTTLPTGLVSPGTVGFQGLNGLGVGRVSATQGISGFVFSASSQTFSLLVRALKTQGRIDILSRPQIQVADNQTGYTNIGQSFPILGGSTIATGGLAQQSVTYVNIGIQLEVTPRVNPDGKVLLRVAPTVSSVSPTTVSLGNGVNATAFNSESLQTTVLASDGETLVLGGLISKQENREENGIPYFKDIPYVGALFRYRTHTVARREILFIMTPQIIRSEFDNARILAEESAQLKWCLAEIAAIHQHGMEVMAPAARSARPVQVNPASIGAPYFGAFDPTGPASAPYLPQPGGAGPAIFPQPVPIVQPGAMQPGAMQPGTVIQPGMIQPGAPLPGAYQLAPVPSNVYQPAPGQSNAMPGAPMQPSAPMQPGVGGPALGVPPTGQPGATAPQQGSSFSAGLVPLGPQTVFGGPAPGQVQPAPTQPIAAQQTAAPPVPQQTSAPPMAGSVQPIIYYGQPVPQSGSVPVAGPPTYVQPAPQPGIGMTPPGAAAARSAGDLPRTVPDGGPAAARHARATGHRQPQLHDGGWATAPPGK